MDPSTVASSPSPPPPPPQSAPSCWTDILRKTPAPKPEEAISGRVFGDLNKSSKGVSVAVVDANAIIHGDKLSGSADKFVTVSEALDEVRDPVSRQRMAFLPLHVETMEPSPDAIKKVVKFARETGDLQTLSDVDLKIIALAYTLEAQIHGTHHLRESPPPIRMVNVKHLPEAEMPGWGKNVPNLAEWEALEDADEGDDVNNASKILPLKDLNFNAISTLETINNHGEQDGEDQLPRRYVRHNCPKKEVKLEGRKMIADGIDASKGQDEDNPDDWRPAVSRSTHRRYLRRKARRELSETAEKSTEESLEKSTNVSVAENCDINSDGGLDCFEVEGQKDPGLAEVANDIPRADEPCRNLGECHLSAKLGGLDLEPNSRKEQKEDGTFVHNDFPEMVNETSNDLDRYIGGAESEVCPDDLDSLEISSEIEESVDASQIDDASSEQSWSLRSLSESSVACVTSDFAMQNVILQIGLRLLVPGGMQIRQLHRWVLKCHACNKVTAEIGRIFCPKCGNGGTLRKVSITVGENGIVLAARRPRITLRGTRFSLPMPQGGRDGISKNPILREDQLPHKMLYPKKKKNKQEKDFFTAEDFFSHSGDKNGPIKAPVGKTVAVFSGRRNPNDNHFSRRNL